MRGWSAGSGEANGPDGGAGKPPAGVPGPRPGTAKPPVVGPCGRASGGGGGPTSTSSADPQPRRRRRQDPEGGPGELLLFVVPAAGVTWDDEAGEALRRTLRQRLSPRHVPDAVHPVASVPRTLSGKKLEVPAKRILQGAPAEQAAAAGALANPEALTELVRIAAGRAGQ